MRLPNQAIHHLRDTSISEPLGAILNRRKIDALPVTDRPTIRDTRSSTDRVPAHAVHHADDWPRPINNLQAHGQSAIPLPSSPRSPCRGLAPQRTGCVERDAAGCIALSANTLPGKLSQPTWDLQVFTATPRWPSKARYRPIGDIPSAEPIDSGLSSADQRFIRLDKAFVSRAAILATVPQVTAV